jgi:hypothetical protein
MSVLTKDNDDVLDVEAQHHDKINTKLWIVHFSGVIFSRII